MSRATMVGLFTGLLLGLALVLGSFGDMLIVALFGAIGVVVVRVLEGELDLEDLFADAPWESTVNIARSDGSERRELEEISDDCASGQGSTTITPRVVEKIARWTTQAVDGIMVPPSPRRARMFIGPDAPAVSAHVDGTTTWLEVRAGLRYPLPLVSSGREIQEAVRERVTALTGLRVAAVDVEVASVFDNTDAGAPVR